LNVSLVRGVAQICWLNRCFAEFFRKAGRPYLPVSASRLDGNTERLPELDEIVVP
jgi:hypothetical protein